MCEKWNLPPSPFLSGPDPTHPADPTHSLPATFSIFPTVFFSPSPSGISNLVIWDPTASYFELISSCFPFMSLNQPVDVTWSAIADAWQVLVIPLKCSVFLFCFPRAAPRASAPSLFANASKLPRPRDNATSLVPSSIVLIIWRRWFARGWEKNVVLDDIQFHLVLFRGVQLQNNLGSKTRKNKYGTLFMAFKKKKLSFQLWQSFYWQTVTSMDVISVKNTQNAAFNEVKSYVCSATVKLIEAWGF